MANTAQIAVDAVPVAAIVQRDTAWLIAVVAVGLLIVLIDPIGYIGGRWDDGRYLAAALDWVGTVPPPGHDHWALRWPVVLPAAAAIRAFGLAPVALMLPGLATFAALLAITFAAVRASTDNRVAAAIAVLCIATAFSPAAAATRLTADLPEALFWSISLWSLVAASQSRDRVQINWLLASGIGLGLGWALRETAVGIGIVMAAALLANVGIPRRRFLWIAAGSLLVILPEQIALWRATGVPFYRLLVDLHHIEIPSTHLAGSTAKGVFAPFNPSLAARWDGGGPVRLFWALDPWANLFLNTKIGLNILAAAILGALAWPRLDQRDRRRLGWVAVVIAANVVTVVYIVATDPQPRMFMPAIVTAAAALGPLAVRAWEQRRRRLVTGLAIAKLLVFVGAIGLASRYDAVPDLAARVLAGTTGPIGADRVTRSHLALAPATVHHRLAAPGTNATLLAIENHGATPELLPGEWRPDVRATAPPSRFATIAMSLGLPLTSDTPEAVLWRCVARCGPLNRPPSVGVGQ